MANRRFEVVHLSHIRKQIEDLAARTQKIGLRKQFLQRLRGVLMRLHVRPWKVGEKLYRTRYPGGVVYKVVKPPFILYFALYESERLVVVFKVDEFPLSFAK